MKTEAAELAIASAASKSTYAGAVSVLAGWLTSSEAAVLIGIVIGVSGLLVNWYYKAKADRRAEALFGVRMDRIKAGQRSDIDLAPIDECADG